MTEEELRLWAESPLQAVFIRNQKIRLACFWRMFVEAKPEELLALQAHTMAHYKILEEYSMEKVDIDQLSAETVDLAEEQKREISRMLEKNQREARDRATRASYPTP